MTLLEGSTALYLGFKAEKGAGSPHTANLRTLIVNAFGHEGVNALRDADNGKAGTAEVDPPAVDNAPRKMKTFGKSPETAIGATAKKPLPPSAPQTGQLTGASPKPTPTGTPDSTGLAEESEKTAGDAGDAGTPDGTGPTEKPADLTSDEIASIKGATAAWVADNFPADRLESYLDGHSIGHEKKSHRQVAAMVVAHVNQSK